ncbi:diacylglycerol kinase family lipid kinase [Hoeflea sp. WL0058]|uniref:Diacylglycerol kinase family lipid kinase n=1 Tax=Flavimaribacter sediminis TaxID=2865987 RepID=A0AAE2ZPE6_9HYPH|nr:diacylglycerol kinase family protein [Flavimaribacter sediminis]MBW8640564.1 diacylglycerol kinase family lipid kinase [Flavimaribacter sediminis]
MSIFVVVNPHAGNGRTGRRWHALSDRIHKTLGTFDHAMTSAAGDATRLVRAAIERGATLVIAVGGDGTFGEAVNGFPDANGIMPECCAFAALAGGTGCDFVRSLGQPSPDPVLRIAESDVRPIDLGKITFISETGDQASRLFINAAGFGLSGEVCRAVNATSSANVLPGTLAYFLATITTVWRHRPFAIRMSIDNRPSFVIDQSLTVVANGRYFGGGMHVAPNARLDSGAFEIMVLKKTPKLQLIGQLPLVYRGAHTTHPSIAFFSGRRLVAETVSESPDRVAIDIDGESPGHLRAEFEILPGALRLRQ